MSEVDEDEVFHGDSEEEEQKEDIQEDETSEQYQVTNTELLNNGHYAFLLIQFRRQDYISLKLSYSLVLLIFNYELHCLIYLTYPFVSK